MNEKTMPSRHMLSLAILLAGCLFLLYFLFGLTMGWDLDLGNLVMLLAGAALITGGSLRLKGYAGLLGLRGFLGNRFLVLRRVVSVLFLLWLISFIAIEGIIIYNGSYTDNKKSDYMIVLGAAMKGNRPSLELLGRLDRAVQYYNGHPDVKVVVSGGQGPGEGMPEGRYMKQYLEGNGVPSTDIICEYKSTSTFENIVYSKRLIQESDKRENLRLTIVTNDFHIFRAKFLARREGFTAYGFPSGTPFYIIPNHYVREYFAIIKSAILDQ